MKEEERGIKFDSLELINKFCNKNKRYTYLISKEGIEVRNSKGAMCKFLFPKEIEIKSSTIGLIHGEGYVKNSFVFANSEGLTIKNVLNFLYQFNIKPKTYIEIATKNIDKEFVIKAKEFWDKIIIVDKIRLRKEFKNTTKNGTLHITYTNFIFCNILKEILEKSKDIIKKDKKLIIQYLKGIIAAEGNINIKKDTKCVYMVRISAKEKAEREFYKSLLEKIGIKITCKDMKTISKEEGKKLGWKTNNGRAGCVIISKWNNFLKILMFNLLELNKNKEDVFKNNFINNKFTKHILEFNKLGNKSFRIKDSQLNFGLGGRYSYRIKRLEKLSLVNKKFIKKVGKNKSYSYKLNENYFKIYQKLLRSDMAPFS